MAWRTAAITSFIACQSSMDRSPGKVCSTVTRTSFGNKPGAGRKENSRLLFGRVDHCRLTFIGPHFSQVACEAGRKRGPRTDRSAIRVARDAGRPWFQITMQFHCFSLLFAELLLLRYGHDIAVMSRRRRRSHVSRDHKQRRPRLPICFIPHLRQALTDIAKHPTLHGLSVACPFA